MLSTVGNPIALNIPTISARSFGAEFLHLLAEFFGGLPLFLPKEMHAADDEAYRFLCHGLYPFASVFGVLAPPRAAYPASKRGGSVAPDARGLSDAPLP